MCSAVFWEKSDFLSTIIKKNKECVFTLVLIAYLFVIVHVITSCPCMSAWTGRYNKYNPHGNIRSPSTSCSTSDRTTMPEDFLQLRGQTSTVMHKGAPMHIGIQKCEHTCRLTHTRANFPFFFYPSTHNVMILNLNN